MANRSPSSGRSGLRLLLRLVSLVAALLVLCVSGRASAATLNAVGMCGDRNESIAAPPIFRGHDPGSIVASWCHSDELAGGNSVPLAPERVVVQQRPERVLGFSVLYLTQCASSRLSIVTEDFKPEHLGYLGAPFRPPRT